ncbi:sensor histidine kinase [Gemmatimonas groenlandica]|uniref:Histidine kinase domain-containing protein n=1 Tax=Gemmatimonas groenlandica TaxID=2732249 RepID=A0A6M4ISF9_9BACT|nr:sensor histidine kinase [Gemmatimonas groenlandica]QJR37580.1 hypothetical protein HKW67_19700 [Gemmatimonas groenlandica]
MAHTPDGYLWIGARIGLVRYDGVRFVAYAPQRGDTLPSGPVLSLLTAHDGSLWIIWGGGIAGHLAGGRLTTYGKKEGLPAAYQIAESSHGTVIAGTEKGLSRLDAGKWKDVGAELRFPGTQSQAVWFDSKDGLWAQTERAVVHLPAGAAHFPDAGTPLLRGPAPAAFAESRDGAIWMAELQRSAHTLSRGDARQPISEVKVGTFNLVIDRRGSLWVGSAGDGLRRVLYPDRLGGRQVAQFGPEAEQYTTKDGLGSDIVYALHEDGEGNIWVGTTRGLESFREGDFTPYPISGSPRPRTIFAVRDSSVWSATYNANGFLRQTPHSREAIDSAIADTDTAYFPTRLFQDKAGSLWAAVVSDVRRLQGKAFKLVPIRHVPNLRLADMVVDDSGTIWAFDLNHGLMRTIRDTLVQVTKIDEKADRGYLYLDRKGRIWNLHRDEVSYYERGVRRTFRVGDGTAPRGASSVFEDRAGDIWLTGEAGLAKLEARGFRTLPERRGVPGRTVNGVVTDAAGTWWMLTKSGLLRLIDGEANRALNDSTHSLQYRTFDQLDGFPGSLLAFEGPRVAATADGLIWIATDSGLANLDPRRLSRRREFPAIIEAARMDGRDLLMSEAVIIPPGGRDLEIDYTAANLARPDRMQFRYRLDGEDSTWHDVGARRRAYYNGLGPGKYTFQVSARNGEGEWNEAGAPLSFEVLPAWYQTILFRIAVVMLIGAIGATSAVAVQRRRHMISQRTLRGQYEAKLAERARIAQDLHDTLLQGFAGVALEIKAAELALPERPDIAAETLMRVQRLTHNSLREARESVWDMHETELGGQDLPAALETCIRERTAGMQIQTSVESSGNRRRLAPSIEHAAYRIGREAISNAVKHADATRIEVHVAFTPETVRLEVRDDGRGFTPEQAEVARHNGHFGLSGMSDRASATGGRCELRANPGGGTVVTLELPLTSPG